jgi:heterodisulfide reductase subunit C
VLKKQTIQKIDKDFLNDVIDLGSKIFPKEDMTTLRACLQCGTCTGSCPSGRRTAWRIRQIFLKTINGLREETLSSDDLWNCTTCYTCQERCPRKVKTTDIVRVLRNLAVKEGRMRPEHVKVCEVFFKHGHAVPANDDVKVIRKRLGLSELPPTVHMYPDALKEVLVIVDEKGFRALVERKGG